MSILRIVTRVLIAVAVAGVGSTLLVAQEGAEHYWAQWRGPAVSGSAPHATPPLEWSETSNVRWKVEIPGRGAASPVVWGNQYLPPDRPAQGGLGPRVAPTARRGIPGGADLPGSTAMAVTGA